MSRRRWLPVDIVSMPIEIVETGIQVPLRSSTHPAGSVEKKLAALDVMDVSARAYN